MSRQNRARVWDVTTSQTLHQMKVDTRFVTCLAVASDSSCIVTGSEDGSARVWDARLLEQLSPEEELTRRQWLTRPDPEWHVQRQNELAAEGNTYGVALHSHLEALARGLVAAEYGRFSEAWFHLVHAEMLKPPSPKVLDLAPMPRPMGEPFRIPSARQ